MNKIIAQLFEEEESGTFDAVDLAVGEFLERLEKAVRDYEGFYRTETYVHAVAFVELAHSFGQTREDLDSLCERFDVCLHKVEAFQKAKAVTEPHNKDSWNALSLVAKKIRESWV